MRTILAIDPGTAITGYSLLSAGPKGQDIKLINYGCITTKAKTPLPQRLVTIANDLQTLITKYNPQELAVEKLFFAKNVKTGIAVGQARGVVLLLGAKNNLEIFEYTPLQIKQAVTGYGQASKQQIQQMVQIIMKLKQIPKPDDAADAIAAGLCHLQTYK